MKEWKGSLRIDDDEVDELEFFDLQNLPEPLYPIHVETITDYQHGSGEFILR